MDEKGGNGSLPDKQKKGKVKMKQVVFSLGLLVVAVMLAGCAGVATQNGGVTLPTGPGANFYSDIKANAMLNTPATGAIVKRGVSATATLESYFGVVCLGDASYATLKAAALKQAAGAKDLINVKMDYAMKNIIGINKVTVTMTADAIK